MQMGYFDAKESYKLSKTYSGRLGKILGEFETKVIEVASRGQYEVSLTFDTLEYEDIIMESTFNELQSRGFTVDYELNCKHSDGQHYIRIEWYDAN